jgi:hypothetical protein
VSLDDDMVIFRNRMSWQPPKAEPHYPVLDPECISYARLVAPGYDVHFLEHEWRDLWVESGIPELIFPQKAFVAFCKSRYRRNPNP